MDKKIIDAQGFFNYLSEYLVKALDELAEANDGSGFVNGEITAFVECLEIIMKNSGYCEKDLLNIEKKYQIV